MIDSLLIITIITLGAVIFNIYVAIRALALSMALESGCEWVCKTIGHDCVMRVLFGIAVLCFMLATLKAWTIFDMYMDYWIQLSPMFKMRMLAFLAENYGVAILGYAVISMIQGMTRCSTSVKYEKLQKKITRECKDAT